LPAQHHWLGIGLGGGGDCTLQTRNIPTEYQYFEMIIFSGVHMYQNVAKPLGHWAEFTTVALVTWAIREVLQKKSAKQRRNSNAHSPIGLRLGPAGPARSMVGRSQEKVKCDKISGTPRKPDFSQFTGAR
jgi:hypothetical protein